MKRLKKRILLAAVAMALPVAVLADVVFDPTNFAEAALQVADDVQLVEQFQQQIQNQLAMLKGWGFTDLPGILSDMNIWQQVFGQADAGSTYSSSDPGNALNSQYPANADSYNDTSDSQMASMRSGWNQDQRSVLIENRTVQNDSYQSMQPTAERIQAYVEHSNDASGATAAMQAGNEEVATLVSQVQTLQAQEITSARAEVQQDAQEQAEEAYAEQERQAVRGDWDNPQQPTTSLMSAFPAADQ